MRVWVVLAPTDPMWYEAEVGKEDRRRGRAGASMGRQERRNGADGLTSRLVQDAAAVDRRMETHEVLDGRKLVAGGGQKGGYAEG